MRKLLTLIVLSILLLNCSTEEIEPSCYKVTYVNGIETSREIWTQTNESFILSLNAVIWYEHFENYSVRKQILTEIKIECN